MNILVIRPGAIGDTLLTFPVLEALRMKYAKPYIAFVGNASVLALAQICGLVDEVSDYQDGQWSELFSTRGIHTPALKSRLQALDMAICWLRDAEGVVEHNLRTLGIRQLTIAPGRPPEGERIHIVDYLAKSVRVEVEPPQRIHKAEGEYIAIHPGSGGAQKCWPAASFVSVIERLWERQRPVLLLAGPADAERLAYIERHLAGQSAPDMFRIVSNAPLVEVAHQLRQCKGYLGNDSGITHLAAMLGVPTVAIFGPSDPTIWRPVGYQVSVIHEPKLENLSVDVVMEAISSFYQA